MSDLFVQMKEHLLADCEAMQPKADRSMTFFPLGRETPVNQKNLPEESVLLDCSIQAITGGENAGILSRVIYRFSTKVSASLEDVFRYEAALNQRLIHSKVFVVQDLDGDQGYYLRMDTVIKGRAERRVVSAFLDDVTEDVAILLTYFEHPVLQKQPPQQVEAPSGTQMSYGLKTLFCRCG